MTRLPYGATKNMTPEEYKIYKRNLSNRWRHNHPEWVKAQNKHYSELYSKTKPFKCICVDCGSIFQASRNTVKHCPKCRAERAYIAEMKRKTITLKQEERRAEYEQILVMRKMGIRQRVIADVLNRSQSGISSILRRLKPLKK